MPQRVPTMKKTPSSKKPAAKSPQTAKLNKNTSDFSELRSLQEIKDLIEFAADKQFEEIELERGDFRLRLSKGGKQTVVHAPPPVAPQIVAAPVAAPAAAPPVITAEPVAAVPASSSPALSSEDEGLYIITSPIVGTFYRSSSPTADPFIKIGDAIESGQTLCIVEAMKLMNEVQADVSGTVAKILVENAQPVEYGQPLFAVKL